MTRVAEEDQRGGVGGVYGVRKRILSAPQLKNIYFFLFILNNRLFFFMWLPAGHLNEPTRRPLSTDTLWYTERRSVSEAAVAQC